MKENNKKILPYLLGGSGIIIIFVVGIIVIVTSFLAKKEIEDLTIKNENLYMYFGNQKISFSSEIELNRENSITTIKTNGKEIELNAEPIYYEKKDKVILSSNMSVIFPLRGLLQKRVNYYTTISNENNQIIANSNGLTKDITGNILFDGNDLYIFTIKTEISFGKEKITVSPLSYVLCNYRGDLFVYDYATKSMKTYENVLDMVYAKNENYEVNLSVDTVKFNEKSIILTKNINNLGLLK